MLSSRRIEICVPCSTVTVCGAGLDGGVSGGGASRGAGAGGWEFSATVPSLAGTPALASAAVATGALTLDFLPGEGLTVGSAGGGAVLAVLVSAVSAVAVGATAAAALPTFRLLTTSFTPSTDAACRAAAVRCMSLSTKPASVTTPSLACTFNCLLDSPES